MKPTKIWKHTKKTVITFKFDSEKAMRAAWKFWKQRVDGLDLSGCKEYNQYVKLDIWPKKKIIKVTVKGNELNKFLFG